MLSRRSGEEGIYHATVVRMSDCLMKFPWNESNRFFFLEI